MLVLSASKVPADQLAEVDRAVDNLPADSPLGAALRKVSESVRTGQDVVVTAADDMTPAQAAKILRMSRTHLYKLMDAGQIPSTRVGRDRRLRAADILDYEQKRAADCAALAERFAHADRDRRALIVQLARADAPVGDE